MKTILLAAALAAMLPACAQTQPNAPPTQTQAQAPAEFDARAAQVQENIDRMQAQMDRIRKTGDPAERERLLQEHWLSMQSNMRLLHGMSPPGATGGPGMRGGMMGWRHMGGYYAELTPEQLRQRQYMTDQRLRMQEMMMNQMMEHQYWAGQPRPPSSGR